MTDAIVRFPVNPLQPGGYSVLDASSLSAANNRTGPVVAVVGACKGGAPNTVLGPFRDPQALRSLLRSGAAYDCARLALLGGVSRVLVVRAGASILQSTKNLAGTSGTAIVLTSIDYGSWTTSIKATVEANNKVTITYVDPNGVTFTEVFAVGAGATSQQVADAINGKTPGINKSQYVTAATGAGTMPLAVAAIGALASGSDGSALDATAWQNGLVPLETKDVSIVVVATGDATIHASVKTHCDAMSTVSARHERTTVIGSVLAETDDQQVTRAANIRAARVEVVSPGATFFNDQGVPTSYDAFYLAAYLAGVWCAQPDEATSLTHEVLPDILDLETAYSTIQGGSVDKLLAAGVTPITPRPSGGFWVVDALSTWTTDDTFRDFHKIRTADASSRRLRERLEAKFTGGKVLTGTRGEILQEAISELNDQTTAGLIVGFKRPQVSGNGNRTLLSVPLALPETDKYILITMALQPASALTA